MATRKVILRLTVPMLAIVLMGASIPQPVRGISPSADITYLPTIQAGGQRLVIDGERQLPQIPPRPRASSRTLFATLTAYSSTEDQTDSTPFITASGAHVRRGTIAWNAVPIGTEVRFPEVFGDEIFVVEDRLNAHATDYHLDLWMPSREQATQWGARILKVEVL